MLTGAAPMVSAPGPPANPAAAARPAGVTGMRTIGSPACGSPAASSTPAPASTNSSAAPPTLSAGFFIAAARTALTPPGEAEAVTPA